MVVKPYLNKFLTSENLGQLMDIDIQSDLHKKIICNKCEKIFDTTQGLKIHMSKMHVQQSRSLSKRTLEVNKDIESLIDQMYSPQGIYCLVQLARSPEYPQRIRVASVFEFFVCLIVLCLIACKQIFSFFFSSSSSL